MKRSVAAVVAGGLGLLGVFDVLLAPVLIHLGLVSPMFGFQWLFVLGLFEGLLALLVGLFALWRTREGSGRSGRGLAWTGIACGVGLVGLLLVSSSPGQGLPRINDITTDLEDPPAFAGDPSDRGRDMTYPADFVPQVREAYPDLATQIVATDPATTLAAVRTTAESLGWEIVSVDEAAGTLEARETTRIFQFVDDVVVRVRPSGNGSEVDIRSKSRDGQGDVGANAARIRTFQQALGGA